MIELVSLLGGAIVRLCTWGSEYFTKKQENTHELELLTQQIALEKIRGQEKRDEIITQGQADVDVEWGKALNSSILAASTPTGNSFVDSLNAIIRPTLALWWCLVLYSVSKGFLIYAAVLEKLSAKEMAGVVTTDFDKAVIGSVVGFYFADRAIRKFTGK